LEEQKNENGADENRGFGIQRDKFVCSGEFFFNHGLSRALRGKEGIIVFKTRARGKIARSFWDWEFFRLLLSAGAG
jgi:hypothetical protein